LTPFITGGAGFLLAVLWFDLMHDVQVLRHRQRDAPEEALASIAGYYRRVTTDASPMNRLVSTVMLVTIICVIVQLVRDDLPNWVSWASLVLIGGPVALAAGHTFRAAVRLGRRRDPIDVQSALARSILRDHLLCLVAIVSLLVVQLGFAR
jgi:ER membrane protein SH3